MERKWRTQSNCSLSVLKKTFDAAVALGFTDEGGRGLDPEEPDFVLKVIAHELRSVIVAKLESCRAMDVKAGHRTSSRQASGANLGSCRGSRYSRPHQGLAYPDAFRSRPETEERPVLELETAGLGGTVSADEVLVPVGLVELHDLDAVPGSLSGQQPREALCEVGLPRPVPKLGPFERPWL